MCVGGGDKSDFAEIFTHCNETDSLQQPFFYLVPVSGLGVRAEDGSKGVRAGYQS